MTTTTTDALDPTWSDALVAVHDKAAALTALRLKVNAAAFDLDSAVLEAVDEGERYQDIARAASKSTPWVQTVLRRRKVEGPRVRFMSARAAAAKRMDEAEARGEKINLDDMMP
ncbi:MAG TPA: hypothetical protein VH482_17385 [Thermomicrobiales bacterium]|jgi:hypothetical protein